MAMQPNRVRSNLKINKGRIILVEQQLGRLEKRLEKLEKQNAATKAEAPKRDSLSSPTAAQLEKHNASLRAELSKLRTRVDQNERAHKDTNRAIARLVGLCEPIQTLVRSFKQTPDAPFTAWRMWMLSTFRKQGLYRKQLFK